MTELPVIQDCNNCGACCLEQESPPGYVWLLVHGGDRSDADDLARLASLPEKLRRELLDYIDDTRAGKPHPRGGVCLWFDKQSRRCKHYDLRPSICRDVLQPGDEACLEWRAAYGVATNGSK